MFTSENNDTDRRNWEKAIQSEMESLQKNITWLTTQKPKDTKYCRTTIATSKSYYFMILDVKTAFLYGELTGEVYMKLPVSYETDCNTTEVVYRFKKLLYGLKQGPFTWNKTFTQAIFDLGFKTIKTDLCVFINQDKSIIIGLFVDDVLVIGKDKKKIEVILKKLETNFKMKMQVLIQV
ncbi:unnamed protein product [Pieris brassicae]|uniref:PH domain-containing protein n=1 Tax=Pieris brassicae TaxID=7116 RepID=A0A9P0TFK5_PIEBR|nr:unnamed protein product [Pieris brassicae]